MRYTIYVDRTKLNVNISATLVSDKASIKQGIGNKVLLLGKNEISIIVVSELGFSKSYELNIIRAENKNTITDISLLDNNDKEISLNFDSRTKRYNIDVPYHTNSVNIKVQYDGYYGTIYGGGLKLLSVGENNISVYVYSEANIKGTEYSLFITRKNADRNNYLSDLQVIVNGVNKISNFDKTINRYSVKVGDNVTVIRINATPESSTSSVNGVGTISLTEFSGDLESGNVIFLDVEVKNELGEAKIYYINISRDGVNLSDDNAIHAVTIIGSDGVSYFGTSDFDSSNYSYRVVVPYRVSSISVDVVSGGTVTGKDNYQITTIEEKIIDIYAVSQSGIKGKVYRFTIIREEANDETKLNYIKINGELLDGFNPEVKQYTLDVSNEIDYAYLDIELMNQTGNYSLIVNGLAFESNLIPLIEGTTFININVFADDSSFRIYSISIYRDYTRYQLKSLLVKNYNLLNQREQIVVFNKDIYNYYVSIPYDKTSIEIEASVEDGLTYSISKLDSFDVGNNEVIIRVSPSDNTSAHTDYKLVVIRKNKVSSDVTALNVLIPECEDFTSFNKDVERYEIEVASNIKTVNFDISFAEREDEIQPSYEVLNNGSLSFGENNLVLIITSSDGTNRAYYYFTVKRKNVVLSSPKIDEISEFSIDYNDSVDYYTYQVEKGVTSLHISFEKDNDGTSFLVRDNKLYEGRNVIVIEVLSNDDLVRKINIIVYRREAKVSMQMEQILITGGAIVASIIITVAVILIKKRKIEEEEITLNKETTSSDESTLKK